MKHRVMVSVGIRINTADQGFDILTSWGLRKPVAVPGDLWRTEAARLFIPKRALFHVHPWVLPHCQELRSTAQPSRYNGRIDLLLHMESLSQLTAIIVGHERSGH